MIRTIVYWGLYWGPPILGNYQMDEGSPSYVGLSPQQGGEVDQYIGILTGLCFSLLRIEMD